MAVRKSNKQAAAHLPAALLALTATAETPQVRWVITEPGLRATAGLGGMQRELVLGGGAGGEGPDFFPLRRSQQTAARHTLLQELGGQLGD